jgi:hypothetical protein
VEIESGASSRIESNNIRNKSSAGYSKDELTHGWDKILLLVYCRDVRLVCFLADHLHSGDQLILSNPMRKATQGEDSPGPRTACVYIDLRESYQGTSA